jgi:hypothetical protein
MRAAALAAAAALALAGCSIFLDPTRVPLKCTGTPSVAGGPLQATAGDGTSLTFDWPFDVGIDGGYRLCVGPDVNANAGCHDYGTEICDGGHCSVTLGGADSGFQYNARTYAQLLERDVCQHTSETAHSPAVSVTPINGTFNDLEGIALETDCDAGLFADAGHLTFVAQAANVFSNCVSVAAMGDQAWTEATLDVEVRLVGNTAAGLAFHDALGATPPREAAVFTSWNLVSESVFLTRRDNTTSNVDVPTASAVPTIQDGVWYALRVSIMGSDVSVGLAPLGMPLVEVLRWHDVRATNPGRLGVALVSILGQPSFADLHNLRVRTGAEIPDGGATQASWKFVGSGALDGMRISTNNPSNVGTGPCPASYGTACADCAPAVGSSCLELKDSTAAFDMPLGIDPFSPWSVHFKFAAVLGDGANGPMILRTSSGDFAAVPIISAMGLAWNQDLQAFTTDLGRKLTPNVWNRFDLTFDGAGSYSLVWNDLDAGTAVSIPSPPPVDPHVGALILGGSVLFGNLHAYYSDVTVSQP